MLKKLKPRYYSLLVLFAIVVLETTAIAVDRVLAKSEVTAFEVNAPFKNNALLENFKAAEAKNSPASVFLAKANLSAPRNVCENQIVKKSFTQACEAQKIAKVEPGKLPVQNTPVVFRPPSHWINFKVAKGDSLASIASRFGLASKEILEANGIADQKSLKAGQVVKIPADSSKKMYYNVKAGDSLSKIAARFGLSLVDIVSRNHLASHNLSENQKIEIPVKTIVKNVEIPHSGNSASTNNLEMLHTPSLSFVNQDLAKVSFAPMQTSLQMVKKPGIEIASDPLNPPKLVIERTTSTKKTGTSVKPELLSEPLKTFSGSSAEIRANRGFSASTKGRIDESKLVIHTVKNGDTLVKVAKQYDTTVTEIMCQNRLPSASLKPGQKINVPASKRYFRVMQVSTHRNTSNAKVYLPVRGRLSDAYGWRNHPVWHRRLFHAGIDLAAPYGSPIYSSMAGTVVYAGWRSGYGKLIVVRHANGYSTRYGHCSAIKVFCGQPVRAGQVIGGVGCTGTATGNHLHFEIRKNGQTLNPEIALGLRSQVSRVKSYPKKRKTYYWKKSSKH
ncbi:MAG: LysM peptidoglycan-binding domain-containing protein [Candidatus Riflebacteria bacterium]|nr:LysM peptidoglycan-binding domain-containing protein [Candidatus Riflebacteria bacterium]